MPPGRQSQWWAKQEGLLLALNWNWLGTDFCWLWDTDMVTEWTAKFNIIFFSSWFLLGLPMTPSRTVQDTFRGLRTLIYQTKTIHHTCNGLSVFYSVNSLKFCPFLLLLYREWELIKKCLVTECYQQQHTWRQCERGHASQWLTEDVFVDENRWKFDNCCHIQLNRTRQHNTWSIY